MVPNLIGYAYQKLELRLPYTNKYNAYKCGPLIFVANQVQFIFQLTDKYQSGPIHFLIGGKLIKWKPKLYRLCPICDQEQDWTCRYCTKYVYDYGSTTTFTEIAPSIKENYCNKFPSDLSPIDTVASHGEQGDSNDTYANRIKTDENDIETILNE